MTCIVACNLWVDIPLLFLYSRKQREFSATRTRWRTIMVLNAWVWGTAGMVTAELLLQPPKMATEVHLSTCKVSVRVNVSQTSKRGTPAHQAQETALLRLLVADDLILIIAGTHRVGRGVYAESEDAVRVPAAAALPCKAVCPDPDLHRSAGLLSSSGAMPELQSCLPGKPSHLRSQEASRTHSAGSREQPLWDDARVSVR